MGRSRRIDALRGFAIFLVILGHSIILYPVNLHNVKWCEILFYTVAAFHLPLFYCIAGYCYKEPVLYKSYVIKKIKRLLLPYITFSTLSLVTKCMLPSLVNGATSIKRELIATLFYGGAYSFLYILFILFLIFPFVEKGIKKWRYLLVVLMMLSMLSNLMAPAHYFFAIDNVAYYLLYFTVGYYIKNFVKNDTLKMVELKYRLPKIVITLLIVAILMWVNYFNNYRLLEIIIALLGIIAFALMFSNPLFQRLFSDVGQYTLQLYLLNGYLLVVSRTIICSVLHVTSPLIIIIFNMIVDYVFSYYLIKYVISKIKPARLLMGM